MDTPSLRLLHPADYRVMPWKNGGGTTTELIIEPEGSSLDRGFAWRLSMADVASSGPFSRFEGCDRTLLLLDGCGMRLEVGTSVPVELAGPGIPFRFSGDEATSGHLLGGSCRDFNVISRRAACRHRLEVVPAGTGPHPAVPGEVRFVFCASGEAQVEPLGIPLAAGDLLRVAGDARPLTVAATGLAVSVGLERLSPDPAVQSRETAQSGPA